ncbi:MAG: hypothetical protein V3U95_08535, partial [Dehalococcoidia bacterium]
MTGDACRSPSSRAAAEMTVPQGECRSSGASAPINVTGGTGDPSKIILVDKDVTPNQVPSFQTTTFTYTITATNISGGPVIKIEDAFDVLPRFFDYVPGSSIMNGGSNLPDPTITLDPFPSILPIGEGLRTGPLSLFPSSSSGQAPKPRH